MLVFVSAIPAGDPGRRYHACRLGP